jgi:hypothetical protein
MSDVIETSGHALSGSMGMTITRRCSESYPMWCGLRLLEGTSVQPCSGGQYPLGSGDIGCRSDEWRLDGFTLRIPRGNEGRHRRALACDVASNPPPAELPPPRRAIPRGTAPHMGPPQGQRFVYAHNCLPFSSLGFVCSTSHGRPNKDVSYEKSEERWGRLSPHDVG